MSTVKDFYDELAPYFHLILSDWEQSINRQAAIFDSVIRSRWGKGVRSIVDVSCGIGTQAIGLAQLGYSVSASDLSPKAIERAKIESRKRGLNISYSVADMREVSSHYSCKFDVLISCDNSIPHLLTDDDITAALSEFYRCLKSGGGCLFTMRDYDKERHNDLQVLPYQVKKREGVKYIPFQIREYDGVTYELSMYLLTDDGRHQPDTKIFRTKYYAVSIPTVIRLMKEAGFTKVQQLECEFYQPVIVGTKPVW